MKRIGVVKPLYYRGYDATWLITSRRVWNSVTDQMVGNLDHAQQIAFRLQLATTNYYAFRYGSTRRWI